MFDAFKIKDFRVYWLGMLVSFTGSWVQTVAQSWLVFDLTGSAWLLGVVAFLGTAPILVFSLFAGVFADRLNKKNILILTQTIFMALAFTLAFLVQEKLVTVQAIMMIAFLNGIVMAFDSPTRQSIVVELVGKRHLLNAIALNSAAFNSARVLGPALGGIFIASLGMAGCFYINGFSFLAVLAALMVIKLSPYKRAGMKDFLGDLREGLRFVRNNPGIKVLMLMVGTISVFGLSYVVLLPVLAKDFFGLGPSGLGMMMSASGAGALLSAVSLASVGDFRNKEKFLFINAFIFSLGLILFSLCKVYILSLVLLSLIGYSAVSVTSIINTILQSSAPDEFRSRVISIFMLTFSGGMPLGSLFAGWVAQIIGASQAFLAAGSLCLIFFYLLFAKGSITIINNHQRR
ncbi:MAG: MFS transporter [Candidatus Omnitrophica bacterium]|jgi:MFS family permease|nr:MFS transporter [Candidatus Omnitrophota bacterium]